MDRLAEAYRSAVIDLHLDDGTVQHIPASGPRDRRIELPPEVHHLHVVTAWNPGSRALPRRENDQRNRRLERDLVAADLPYLTAVGRSPDGTWAEESYAVVDAEEATVLRLAAQHGQHAIYRITSHDVVVVWVREARR